jgi:hypothetical protein
LPATLSASTAEACIWNPFNIKQPSTIVELWIYARWPDANVARADVFPPSNSDKEAGNRRDKAPKSIHNSSTRLSIWCEAIVHADHCAHVTTDPLDFRTIRQVNPASGQTILTKEPEHAQNRAAHHRGELVSEIHHPGIFG